MPEVPCPFGMVGTLTRQTSQRAGAAILPYPLFATHGGQRGDAELASHNALAHDVGSDLGSGRSLPLRNRCAAACRLRNCAQPKGLRRCLEKRKGVRSCSLHGVRLQTAPALVPKSARGSRTADVREDSLTRNNRMPNGSDAEPLTLKQQFHHVSRWRATTEHRRGQTLGRYRRKK
jgi:hypothetical protein